MSGKRRTSIQESQRHTTRLRLPNGDIALAKELATVWKCTVSEAIARALEISMGLSSDFRCALCQRAVADESGWDEDAYLARTEGRDAAE